jgi:hypothetical protein
MGFGVVGGDAVGDEFEEGGLAGFGRRDDHAALALADGGDDVYEAAGDVLGGGLHEEAVNGVDGGELVEAGPLAGGFGGKTVDGLELEEAVVALAALGIADRADDGVAGSEREALDLGLGR